MTASGTIAVFRSTAVAHLAVTHEVGIGYLQTVVDVPVARVDLILEPCLCSDCTDVVVIAELIPFAHFAVGIIEVVLQYFRISGEVALREVVDIAPEFSAEEVADSLEVMTVGIIEAQASLKRHYIVDTVVNVRIEHPRSEVAVAVLENVTALADHLGIAVEIRAVELIGPVDCVPVDLTQTFIVLPEIAIVEIIVLIVCPERRIFGSFFLIHIIAAPGIGGIII